MVNAMSQSANVSTLVFRVTAARAALGANIPAVVLEAPGKLESTFCQDRNNDDETRAVYISPSSTPLPPNFYLHGAPDVTGTGGDFSGAEKALVELTAQLTGTPYEALALTALSGGNANFIFHAVLKNPLPDGTREVVVKHGEGFVAANPNFKISIDRCEIEVGALQAVNAFAPVQAGSWTVRAPKTIFFDPALNNHVQECKPAAKSLKEYALRHFATSSPALEVSSVSLGTSLGTWLRAFHAWANDPTRADLRQLAARNQQLQGIKQYINYGSLVSRIDSFPAILSDSRALFEQVAQATADEIVDPDRLSVIHGDFWTGKLRRPSLPKEVFVVDWEMFQLGVFAADIGQMITELYELKLYKDIDAGLWIIQGLCAGYGVLDKDVAFRALVTVGAHLLCFGTTVAGWGTPDMVEQVAREGRDILTAAWAKDEAFFENHPLGCVLSGAS
ncbi:unnamed protein product [Parascedosporium putredinis]|uniref:Aminoglycoside phosphotransferase domain-containing protein n=1 Tax=Parascedosporium putredinis TaxID=1442378 RepID=A0A9P1GWV7_9PEZI|nr:unnamed protein product [Parascedosporium putredinis]CAI7989272.1 unnamed protein product [Parascedosporium putredinis]